MDLPKFKEAQEAVIEKLLTAPGVHGAAYGVTKEAGRDVVVLFVGWDSVEVRTRLGVALTECLLTAITGAPCSARGTRERRPPRTDLRCGGESGRCAHPVRQ